MPEQATYIGPGDPEEKVWVPNPNLVAGGSYKDVGNVRLPDGTIEKWTYQAIREAGLTSDLTDAIE